MKLIINTTNILVGGAFQRALSFVRELKEFGKDEYHVFYRNEFSEQIDISTYPNNFYFYLIEESPASILNRKKIITQFNSLEAQIKPDLVFSFVGPAYWRPKSIHLVGYAVPHIVYNDLYYLKSASLKTKLEMIYKKWWTKREADYWVVQTLDVQDRLSNRIGVPIHKVFLVSNGPGKQYDNIVVKKKEVASNVKKLLMISTFRPSKNFEIIKQVVPLLKEDKYKYEFHITIKQEDYTKHFSGFEDTVINHGHVKAVDCPEMYNDCDAMFLPSHLECFSASYTEAMRMEKPILTSDLPFAHTVCEDAALYFDNLSADDVAKKIKLLFHDKTLYDNLVENAKQQLNKFDSSKNQAKKYLEICRHIINK